MSNCPNCNLDWVYGCKCTQEQITQGFKDQDFWHHTKNLTMEDMEKIYQIIKKTKGVGSN